MCQAFDGPASLTVQLPKLACGESESMVMAPPPTCDSALSPCFHGCLDFLHQQFPLQSPPSHLLNPSHHSQQQPLPWDYSTIHKLQLPATVPSTSIPVQGTYGCSKDCLILIPFRLPQISCFTLLNVSPLTQTVALMWGWDPCFSSPTHRGQVQSC